MMEEELIKIWQSSPNQERVKFERSRLMIELQSSMDHFHKKIKYRDLMEQLAVVLIIPVFAYYAYSIPQTLTKVASVLIIFWGIYIVVRIRNAQKNKPGAFTETYMEYLYKTREYLRIQKHLLDSVLYWYVLPGFALISLFVLGFIGVPGKSQYITKMMIGNTVLAVSIYLLNKRAVKKEFIPRLEKVDRLIMVMEQPSE
jgi:hypothetical protein